MIVPGQRGFTLIELMVAITILFVMMLVAAPLGGGWTDSANVRTANHRLLEGMARAKALALNNPDSKSGTTAAAVLLWDGASFCLYKPSILPATLACDSTALWQAAATATITLNSATKQCVALNDRALAVTATVGSTTCGTALTYSITQNTETYPSSGTNILY